MAEFAPGNGAGGTMGRGVFPATVCGTCTRAMHLSGADGETVPDLRHDARYLCAGAWRMGKGDPVPSAGGALLGRAGSDVVDAFCAAVIRKDGAVAETEPVGVPDRSGLRVVDTDSRVAGVASVSGRDRARPSINIPPRVRGGPTGLEAEAPAEPLADEG